VSTPNRFVATNFSEAVQRLALGVEPIDEATGSRVPNFVQVSLDRVPMPPTALYELQPWEWLGSRLPRFPRHMSCRYAIVYRPHLQTAVQIRLFDGRRHFVPRRLVVNVPTEAEVMLPETDHSKPPVTLARRVVRPLMYPGAAYGVSESTTGLRGRVVRGDAPMRWARVEARLRSTGELVGLAHGDDRGDFLLIVRWRGVQAAPPDDPMGLSIRAYGPKDVPTETYPLQAQVDDLWDLPLEKPVVPVPIGGDNVADGITPPDGYQPSKTGDIDVDLPLGRFSGAAVSAFAFTT
jgi:hypothetical protein